MNNKFYIINTPSLPIVGNFWHTVRKFSNGFSHLGYDCKVINSDSEINNIEDSENNFLFLGDYGLPEELHAGDRIKINEESKIPKTIKELLSKLKKVPKICWFYHNFFKFGYGDLLPKGIITGEHYLSEPKNKHALACFFYEKSVNNHVPLTFLSFVPPELIGKIQRQRRWRAQFVGARYKTEWTSKLKDCYIHHTPPEISEEERINSFLFSDMSLGFSSVENINNFVVTERVAEGLSFGNVVISDNSAARDWTDGIVEYVESFDELSYKINYFYHNDEARTAKQNLGYSWAKEKGTYSWLAKKFIEKAKEI